MSTATLRSRSLFPMEWPTLTWFPLGGPTIRIEEFLEGKNYVVRAELPGVDPDKDIHVTVADGSLRIKVERVEERKGEEGKTFHSEFHYGSLFRQISLPAGAREDTVVATYDKGILEVRVDIGKVEPKTREIPITVGNGKVVGGKRA